MSRRISPGAASKSLLPSGTPGQEMMLALPLSSAGTASKASRPHPPASVREVNWRGRWHSQADLPEMRIGDAIT